MWLYARAALISLAVQFGVGFLFAMLLVVVGTGSAPDSNAPLLVEVIGFSALAFIASFVALRGVPNHRERSAGLVVCAMLGPVLYAVAELVVRPGDIGVGWRIAETVGPLALGAAGLLVSERAREFDDRSAGGRRSWADEEIR